ncbi:MAG: DegV family protein [Pseudomonadota bacterium]
MNYVIVIDSVGCVPESEIKKRSIKVMPLAVTFEGVDYYDTVDESSLISIHNAGRVGVKTESVSVTPTEQNVHDYMNKQVMPNYDVALCQLIGRNYTPIYDAFQAVSKSYSVKAPAKESFVMNCLETGSLAAGQGLTALYSDDLLSEGIDIADYREVIDDFKTLVKSITIVRDSVYIRHRVKQKGNKTVSLPVAMLANALQVSPIANNQCGEIDIIDMKSMGFDKSVDRVLGYCCDRAEEGLVAPLINISFAGDPVTLNKHSNFKRLQHICDDSGIALYTGVMTLAASINLGPGSMSIGIAPINQDIDP